MQCMPRGYKLGFESKLISMNQSIKRYDASFQKHRYGDDMAVLVSESDLEKTDSYMNVYIRTKVRIRELTEQKLSLSTTVVFDSGKSQIVHFPPFHLLKLNSKYQNSKSLVKKGTYCFVTFADDAEQPRILFCENVDLRHLWLFNDLKEVCVCVCMYEK